MLPSSTPATTANGFRVASIAQVRELPLWKQCLREQVKDHRYYEVVADTLGFDCRVLVLEDERGEAIGMQPFFLIAQDLVMTAPGSVRAISAAVRGIAPGFLRMKMLMVGCAAGEGRLTVPERLIPCVQRFLPAAARKTGASMIVWKDIPAEHRCDLTRLKASAFGYAHIASMPATRLPLDFSHFDEYLRRCLSHAMRKNLRRKFKALGQAPALTMTVTNDLGEATEEALALYEQVYAKSKLQFEHLNAAFLRALSAQMPDRVRYFLWRQEGKLVAFSLCFVHEGVLYDEYLGLDYRVALDLHLYFATFRDIVTWAIEKRLTVYHSTPLNYGPKLRLGFTLAPLDLYFTLPWPGMQRLARPFLNRMSPTREEPVLAQFDNAAAMETRP